MHAPGSVAAWLERGFCALGWIGTNITGSSWATVEEITLR